MDERSKVMLTTMLGAVCGSLAGYLYLTAGGRRVRGQIEPLVDTVIDELQQARVTVERARAAAAEGRRVIDEIVRRPAMRPPWESRDAG